MLSNNVFRLIVSVFVQFIIVYNPCLSIAYGNGLISNSSQYNITVYKPDDNSTVVVDTSTVLNRCADQTVCVRKCCPLNYVYGRKNKRCQPSFSSNITTAPVVLRGQLPGQIPGQLRGGQIPGQLHDGQITGQLEEENFKKMLVFEGTDDRNSNSNNTNLVSLTYGYNRPNFYLERDKFSISPDGSLRMLITNQLKVVSEYCLDKAFEDGKLTAWVYLTKNIAVHEPLLSETLYRLYAIGMLISVICLLCTFLIYCSNEFDNLHGKCFKQHTGSLIASYSLMIILTLRYVDYKDTPYCLIIGVAAQFLLLASFFWLNVICFDLWRTFRMSRNISKESSNKRFLHYFLYAWGCPCYITIMELIIEFVPGIPFWIIKPRFGQNVCWLNDEAKFYFYIPVGLVLLANTLMFVNTAVIIIRNKKNSKYLNRNGSSDKRNACEIRRFSICFKLYIVMGLNWIMELLSWYFEDQVHLWFIPDVCNTLQGLFIFLIFVCKRRVLYILDEKFYLRKRFFTRKSRSIWSTTTSLNSTISGKNKSIRMTVLNNEQQQQLQCVSDAL